MTNLNSLFGAAQEEGTLSSAGAQVLNIPDLGAQIQAAIGISVDDVTASEVILVTPLVDDSGSIRFVPGNTEAVRDGHNGLLDALGGSKQSDGILVHCRYLNGTILYPYVPLSQAIRMDSGNYNPSGGTPLYDQIARTLGTVLAKVQEFADAGVPCRSISVILTDGADEHSKQHLTGASVAPLIRDLLRTEMHIIAFMGLDGGQGPDFFKRIASEMGIPAEWILTPKNNPREIRQAFAMVSQSAVRASQAAGAAGFSKVAGGGFGSP